MQKNLSNHYVNLLNSDLSAEQFTRQALSLLEMDLRRMALFCLQEWIDTGYVAPNLFNIIAGLQQPTWGHWNGLLNALRKERNKALQAADQATREKITQSKLLTNLLDYLGSKTIKNATTIDWLKVLYQHAKQPLPRKPSLQHVLSAPIALRNSIVHDNLNDPDHWEALAAAFRPLIDWCSQQSQLNHFAKDIAYPEPWFIDDEDQQLTYNGITRKSDAIIYVTQKGVWIEKKKSIDSVLFAFKKLMGKADLQASDFRQLLGKLAPEDVKGVLMGDYLVGRFIGEGSHGTVHKGIQLSTGGQVAIKFLKEGLSEDMALRFKQEAEFLSRLNHPHIIKVLAYAENELWHAPRAYSLADEEWYQCFNKGSNSGIKTFIAMEWIAGKTLDDYYNTQKTQQIAVDYRQLTHWFIDIAGALAHVHQADIIHRDIKPSNLMLTEQGEIKLMDFGIARHDEAFDARLTTDFTARLGSPAYMSPEQIKVSQAEVQIGSATDIYGITAVFYELYTQQRLYNHDDENVTVDTLTAIKTKGTQRPIAAIKHTKKVSKELNSILSAGLEYEIAARYQNAEDLKRDLLHYLADEPIEYRSVSLLRRMQLGYRRNRQVVNVMTLALLMIVSLTGWYLNNLKIERDKAEQAKQKALDERESAIGLINYMNVDLHDKLKPMGKLAIMDNVQQRITQYFDRIKLDKDDLKGWEYKAMNLRHYADTLNAQGKIEQAIRKYQQAHTISKILAEDNPNALILQDALSVSYYKIANIYQKRGQFDQALTLYQQALIISQTLAKREPNNMMWQRELSANYEKIANIFKLKGQTDQALKKYQQALVIDQLLVKTNPDNTLWQFDLSISYDTVAAIYKLKGKIKQAFKLYRQAQTIRQILAKNELSNAQWQKSLSVSYMYIAEIYELKGQLNQAFQQYQQAFNIQKTLTKKDPDNVQWQHELSVGYDKIANIYKLKGQINQAFQQYQHALVISQTLAKNTPNNAQWQNSLSASYSRIANIHNQKSQTEQALKLYQQALAINQILVKSDPNNVQWQRALSVSHSKIAKTYKLQSKTGKALKYYQEALAISQALTKIDPSNIQWQNDLSVYYSYIADIYKLNAQAEQGLKYYQKVLLIREILLKNDPDNIQKQYNLSVSHNNIADFYKFNGQFDQALKKYQQVVTLSKRLIKNNPDNAKGQYYLSLNYDNVADIYELKGQLDQAFRWYQQALSIRQMLTKNDSTNAEWQRNLSVSYEKIADIHNLRKQTDQALKQYQKSLIIRQALIKIDSDNVQWQRDLSVSYNKIADIYHNIKQQPDQALKLYQQALTIRQVLIKKDVSNIQRQRDLSVSYGNIANIYKSKGKNKQAIKLYQKALAIDQNLAKNDPNNIQWQRDLIFSYVKLSELDFFSAKNYLQQSLEIFYSLKQKKRLVVRDKGMEEDLLQRLRNVR